MLGLFDVLFELEGMYGWKLCELYKEKNWLNWYFSMGIIGLFFIGFVRDYIMGLGIF